MADAKVRGSDDAVNGGWIDAMDQQNVMADRWWDPLGEGGPS